MSEKSNYEKFANVNVNEHTSKKAGLTYLSWAWAWAEFIKVCPDATYEVLKTPEGLPYFADGSGACTFTTVTAFGITREMWLPVMDGANKAMKSEQVTYLDKYKKEKTVAAYTMFDINKTIMRCLTKNLAMFGLGLYIYSGEDLPHAEGEGEQQYVNKHEDASETNSAKKDAFKSRLLKAASADEIKKIMIEAEREWCNWPDAWQDGLNQLAESREAEFNAK